MIKTHVYKPQNVCSKEMTIEYDDETLTIVSLRVLGGCPGNLRGISALVKGMKISDVVERLQGTPCRGVTSCPDQLSLACKEILANEGC